MEIGFTARMTRKPRRWLSFALSNGGRAEEGGFANLEFFLWGGIMLPRDVLIG